MNLQEFRNWQDDVKDHIISLNTIVNDRRVLKENLENHLREFFNFKEIEYDREFSKIILKWDKNTNPTILNDKISELHMDWIISSAYDDMANRIVIVEVYPFGINK